jgi:molybdenum cofactor cytidylyltransferase
MRLSDAFGIKAKEVVSFVGAGGKTTSMFQLARELSATRRVVTTTTTRLAESQTNLAPFVIRVQGQSYARALVDLRKALKGNNHVLVVGAQTEDGKVLGVDPLFIDQIVALEQVDHVLIEADGARFKDLKAPGEHEPVIPASTTLLVPVVGLNILGKPLDEEYVHRADHVTALTSAPAGAPVDEDLIVRVLLDEKGGMKNRPWHAPAIPLLNQVETEAQLLAARSIGYRVLESELVEAVAVGAVQDTLDPVRETLRRVTAIVLAAGAGTRMGGRIKQLLEWDRTTLLGHALDLVRGSEVYQRLLVLGSNADLISAQVDLDKFQVISNPEWPEGRASSVRAGLRAVSERSDAAIFVNADQPFLTSETIRAVVQKYYQTNAPVVVPVYNKQRGSPVLFARSMFMQMDELGGENGGRELLRQMTDRLAEVTIEDARAAVDIDTLEEYERARGMVN